MIYIRGGAITDDGNASDSSINLTSQFPWLRDESESYAQKFAEKLGSQVYVLSHFALI